MQVTSGCVLLPLVSIPTFHKLRYISSLSVVRPTSTFSLATHFLIQIGKVLVWNRAQ